MEYKYFVLIAMVSAAVTLVLAVWKLIGVKTREWDGEEWDTCDGCGERKTFIGRLSWFAVPWPLFIGVAILGGPYIIAVLMADL